MLTQIGGGPGYCEYECELDQPVPLDHPGIGLPAYLLRPLQQRLLALHPGWEVVRAVPTGWNRVALLLRPPLPLRQAYRPTLRPDVDPRQLPYTVVRRTATVAEVRASNGYHYVLPLAAVSARLLARQRQEHRHGSEAAIGTDRDL